MEYKKLRCEDFFVEIVFKVFFCYVLGIIVLFPVLLTNIACCRFMKHLKFD